MTSPSAWTLCHRRVENMCKRYDIKAGLHTGNARCGVSYEIVFYTTSGLCLYELRHRSPSRLFDMLVAFDYGMTAAQRLTEDSDT